MRPVRNQRRRDMGKLALHWSHGGLIDMDDSVLHQLHYHREYKKRHQINEYKLSRSLMVSIPVMRLHGSKTSILSTRSMAAGATCGNRTENGCFGNLGSCLTYRRALSLLTNPISDSSGDPNSCNNRHKDTEWPPNNSWFVFQFWPNGISEEYDGFHLGYKSQLFNIVFTGKQRFSLDNFHEYATDRPDINSSSIFWAVEKQFRSSIPTSYNIFCHEVSLRGGSCKSKVTNLEVAVCIEEQVAGF